MSLDIPIIGIVLNISLDKTYKGQMKVTTHQYKLRNLHEQNGRKKREGSEEATDQLNAEGSQNPRWAFHLQIQ